MDVLSYKALLSRVLVYFHHLTHTFVPNGGTRQQKLASVFFTFEYYLFPRDQYNMSHINCWFFQLTNTNFNDCIQVNFSNLDHSTCTVPGTVVSSCDARCSMSTTCRNGLHMRRGVGRGTPQLLTPPFQFQLDRKEWSQAPIRHEVAWKFKRCKTWTWRALIQYEELVRCMATYIKLFKAEMIEVSGGKIPTTKMVRTKMKNNGWKLKAKEKLSTPVSLPGSKDIGRKLELVKRAKLKGLVATVKALNVTTSVSRYHINLLETLCELQL